MDILLNGETRVLPDGHSVADMLRDTGYGERRVAVEVNLEIVPKSRHAERILNPGDRVEIVQAIGGG